MLAVLSASQRDLQKIDLFEFFEADELDLCPGNAVKRFASSFVTWFGWDYEQQAINRGDVSRYFDFKFNTVTLTLSNVDRTVSTWLSTTELEGFRVLIRTISRSVDDDSVVCSVFRCEKPFDVDQTTVQISCKQDLGSVENSLPWNKLSPKCPLKFKGAECLAGQSLGSKSATYQAATVCNKTDRQCGDYSNLPAFQGERFKAVTGNFKVSQHRGGALGNILGLIGLGNHRVTKQYSSQDDASNGNAVVLGLGRTQTELIPSQHADTGQYLAGHWIVGEGEVGKLLNVRNVSSGWASVFQAYTEHLGKYGYDSSQVPLGFFATVDQRHSHRAYVEATILGENPDTGDSAPTLAAVVLWIKIPVWNGTSFAGFEWTDDPVAQLRYLLTETRSLNYNANWIDDVESGATSEYCAEPLLDASGGEDVYVSTSSGTPGTDFKFYRSTGLLDTYYFRKVLGLTSQYSAEREVTYNTYNPATGASPTPATYYRKRYTSNWHIREFTKAVDFISKNLLASFRGYLTTSAQGKLQIKTEKPTITSYLRNDISIGATSVPVEDALAWRSLNVPVMFALISAGTATSETRRVTSVEFSTASNSITLTSSSSAGISATASGSTLSGGTTAIQAQGTVTFGGTPANGNLVTVTIDGEAVTYTLNADDTAGTVAAIMAARINANPTINRFAKASWTASLPTQIIIRAKLGNLIVSALSFAHLQLDVVAHVHMVFSDVAMGALTRGNVSENTFKWPLGGRASSYNQFTMNFTNAPQDFFFDEVIEQDDDHIEKTNKTSKREVGGACVDNYHQASRLVLAERYKFREGDFFCSWTTTDGRALLLEEGDVVCVNHGSMPGQRNLLLRLEEHRTSPEHKVSMVGRLYADDQFPTSATDRTVQLVTSNGWVSTPPDAVTNLVLEILVAGTVNGTFDFAAYIGTQAARILVKRPGDADYFDTGLRVSPDVDNKGAFSYAGALDGENCFKVIPYSLAGDGPETIECIDTAELDGMMVEDGDRMQEDGVQMVEV